MPSASVSKNATCVWRSVFSSVLVGSYPIPGAGEAPSGGTTDMLDC